MNANQNAERDYSNDGLQHFEPEPVLGVRREYKDRVFKDLFGGEKGRRNAMELYNALGGGPVSNPEELQVLTVDNALYMGWKDDISFLVGDEIVLWEHQSTFNPNMPVRGLGYFSQLYSKIIGAENEILYSSRALKLPTPRFVVFYAGEADRPESEILLLSDLFTGGEGDVEVRVKVLNVNAGNNESIMHACRALEGYAALLSKIREFGSSLPSEQAVDAAVRFCIDNGILSGYLQERRSEVRAMLIDEYEDARQMKLLYESIDRERAIAREEGLEEGRAEGLEQGRAAGLEEGRAVGLEEGRVEGRAEGREEGLEEGRAEGREEGREQGLFSLAGKGLLAADVAAAELGISEEEFAERAKSAGYALP